MLGKVPQGRAGDFLFRSVEDCTNVRETCKELADGREENKLMVTLFLEMDGGKGDFIIILSEVLLRLENI